MSNQNNLKPWKPGQSGNPSGKPKGTNHLSTWIRELIMIDQKNKVYTPEISSFYRLVTKKKDTEVSNKSLMVRVQGL